MKKEEFERKILPLCRVKPRYEIKDDNVVLRCRFCNGYADESDGWLCDVCGASLLDGEDLLKYLEFAQAVYEMMTDNEA